MGMFEACFQQWSFWFGCFTENKLLYVNDLHRCSIDLSTSLYRHRYLHIYISTSIHLYVYTPTQTSESIHLSICTSLHLYIYTSISTSIHQPLHLQIYTSIGLSGYTLHLHLVSKFHPSIYLSISTSPLLFLHLYIYTSITSPHITSKLVDRDVSSTDDAPLTSCAPRHLRCDVQRHQAETSTLRKTPCCFQP